ncbi:hypothetical protein CI102_9087 [Trichoderma harzianum]|nr:hypothetical protein CI102_9087 [Trichoderma harzianum]
MSGVSEPGVPLNRSYGHHSNSASSTSNNTTETECQAVTDPRAIKRLQNRVAQRSYRRRVKLRLAELQERIARYEGTAQVMEGEVLPNTTAVVSMPDPEPMNYMEAGRLTSQTSFGMAKLERTAITQETASFAPAGERGKTPNSNNSRISHGSSLTNCPISGYQISSSGSDHFEESRSQNETGRLDQSDNLHYFNEAQEAGRGQHRGQIVDSSTKKRKRNHDTDHYQHVPSPNLCSSPSHALSASVATPIAATHPFPIHELGGGLDFSFLMANTEGWKSCSCDKSIENSSKSPPDVSILSKVQSAASNLPSCASSSNHPNTDAQVLSPINLSLNKRFQSIMECVGAMGFESFDELVTSYYVDEFEEASQLFHEQRFSRHRRLPVVFADILEGARRWKPSERRGLGEEVLKEAEAVLIAEISQAWKALQPLTDTVLRKAETQHRTCAASDGPAWQRDCSGTALAIIALLHLAGRLPKETLLELIGSCL